MKAIDLQELLKWDEERLSYTLLDIRSEEEFENQHIPRARHIPLDQVDENLSSIDISNPVITICGKGGGRSLEAAQFLREKGYEAYFLDGGNSAYFRDHQ